MTAAFLPAVLFGLGMNAGPFVPADVYVPGNWPYAPVAPRSPAAAVEPRSPSATVQRE